MDVSQRPLMEVILELMDIGATLEGQPEVRNTATMQNTPPLEWSRPQNTKISPYRIASKLQTGHLGPHPSSATQPILTPMGLWAGRQMELTHPLSKYFT